MQKSSTLFMKSGVDSFSETVGTLLTVQEAAECLRLSVSSLNKWRLTGGGPAFVRVGGRVRYRAADLIKYLSEQTRISTSSDSPPDLPASD
jgi:excisionase family DNA binding protein